MNTDSDDSTSNEETSPSASASPERAMLLWIAVIFGANLVCLLMLAARSVSPEPVQGYFDVGVFACIAGVAAFGIGRVLFAFPFGLIDLMVIVVTLALGMDAAIEIVRWIRSERLAVFSKMSEWTMVALACMMTGCALLSGAAVGLRNCRLMKIDIPFKRAVVIVSGMLTIPAPIGLVTIPFHLLNELRLEHHTSSNSLAWIVAMIFSGLITLANSLFSIYSMALNTQNSTQEAKWRS